MAMGSTRYHVHKKSEIEMKKELMKMRNTVKEEDYEAEAVKFDPKEWRIKK